MGEKFAYVLIRGFIFIAGTLPKTWIYFFIRQLTLLFYHISKRRREITIGNLREAFPNKSQEEIIILSKEGFSELCKTIAEILFMLSDTFDMDEAVINTESAAKELHTLRKKYPNGQIVITAHFSNWELAAHFLSKHGHKMLAVGRKGDNSLIDQKLTIPFREKYGNRSIYKKRAAIAIVKALKKGDIVGVLIDQKVNSSEGVKVNFFGREVYTTSLIATMKNKFDIIVVPIFLPRLENGKYKLVISEPIEQKGDIVQMTQAYSDTIESIIKAYPSQWFWMHNRWKV